MRGNYSDTNIWIRDNLGAYVSKRPREYRKPEGENLEMCNGPSRLMYVMAWETFLQEDLILMYLLPRTTAANMVLSKRQTKQEKIWEDFYSTETIMTET